MIVINILTHITGISSSFNSAISKPLKEIKRFNQVFIKTNTLD